MNTNETKTASAVTIRMLYPSLLSLGYDAANLLRRAGIPPTVITDPDMRIPESTMWDFWEIIANESTDPNIGLTLAKSFDISAANVTILLLMTSKNFEEGLSRFIRYRKILDNAYQFSLETEEEMDLFRFCFHIESSRQRHRLEGFSVMLTRLFRWVTNGRYKPLLVSYAHDAPSDCTEHQQFFQCPVYFAQDRNYFEFHKDILGFTSMHASPELCKLNEQFAEKVLKSVSENNIVTNVKSQLITLLEYGPRDIETVANMMQIDVGELKREILGCNTSFSEILETLRHDLAIELLQKGNHSITDIVYLTGYSDPANFYRAFKRWESTTPAEFVAKLNKGRLPS